MKCGWILVKAVCLQPWNLMKSALTQQIRQSWRNWAFTTPATRSQTEIFNDRGHHLMTWAQGLEEGEKDLQARKLVVENREPVSERTRETFDVGPWKGNRAFGETSSSQANQLQDKEKGISDKLNDLRALESDDSRMKAITSFYWSRLLPKKRK